MMDIQGRGVNEGRTVRKTHDTVTETTGKVRNRTFRNTPSAPPASPMPADRPIKLLFDEAMLAHDAGRGHPERPDRLRAIVDELRRQPIDGAKWAAPQAA